MVEVMDRRMRRYMKTLMKAGILVGLGAVGKARTLLSRAQAMYDTMPYSWQKRAVTQARRYDIQLPERRGKGRGPDRRQGDDNPGWNERRGGGWEPR